MDEITYWIYTKRAPCLMNYDKLLKNRPPESSAKCKKPLSISDDPKTPSPKKKKRKLTILDDSDSEKEHRNVYFQSSNQPPILQNTQSSKSSDVNFNNKKMCIKEKPKRRGLQKNIRPPLRKKHALATSTPKVTTTLRRSLRNSHKGNESQLMDTSFEVLNGVVKSPNKTNHVKLEECKNQIDETTNDDQVAEIGRITTKEKLKDNVNGKFEDLSDVSGFTANYIRSTKLDSTKNGKPIGSKNMQSLLKESQQVQIVPMDTIHDESVHSSQNCLNIVDNKKKTKRRSSPISKPVFSKTVKNTNNLLNSPCQKVFNHSFQLQNNTTTRYPKRVPNNMSRSEEKPRICKTSPRKNKKVNNNTINSNNDCSERKENPGEALSRTRSGRSLALTIRQSDNSILFVNTADALQEVTPKCTTVRNSLKKPKNNDLLGKSSRKKSLNKSGESMTGGRESLRDKSGFAACFSDSDDDKPLKPHKYFC